MRRNTDYFHCQKEREEEQQEALQASLLLLEQQYLSQIEEEEEAELVKQYEQEQQQQQQRKEQEQQQLENSRLQANYLVQFAGQSILGQSSLQRIVLEAQALFPPPPFLHQWSIPSFHSLYQINYWTLHLGTHATPLQATCIGAGIECFCSFTHSLVLTVPVCCQSIATILAIICLLATRSSKNTGCS